MDILLDMLRSSKVINLLSSHNTRIME